MGSWLATTSMGENPVINVEIWNDGTTRNGTSITAHVGLCLKAINGYNWWGYGVNVSWGWYDASGRWVQGQDVIMKSNSETQWEDTRYWVDFTVDTGNYDAGALNASFCVYPNSGAWGNGAEAKFWYDSGYIAPSRGNVSAEVPLPNLDVWFETININWDSFNGGTSGISYYGIFKQEGDTYDGSFGASSGIEQVWTSENNGSFQWNGMSKHPMYYLKNVKTGKYMDVNDGELVNNQPVNTYPFNGSQAQRWSFESISGESNTYFLHPDDAYNALMEISNGEAYDGKSVQLYEHHGYDHQKFILVPSGLPNNSYYIVPKHAQEFCLDVDDGNLTTLQLWTRNQSENQQWILEDASDAWRGRWFQFNVVAVANDGNKSDQSTFIGSWRKNQRPTPALNPSATPNPVNLGQPINLTWGESTDSDFRANNKYEIELERSRNGDNYVKVGDSFYSNTNSLSTYTGYSPYAMPGDLFRFRVRGYDFFDISSAWSVYGTFEIQKSGINYPVGEQWKGHYVHVVLDGTWTICQVFIVQKNQWEQCIMQ